MSPHAAALRVLLVGARGRWQEAGLARAASLALLVLAEQGISHPEQEQQTWYSSRESTTWQGFCQGFCRGLVWREHAVPDLPAVHLAQKTPSCAGLRFSSPSLRAYGLFCEEKQQFNQLPSWEEMVCIRRRGEDEGEGALSHLWQCGRTV